MLRIENLNVSYGETLILRGVNLKVGAGEVVCLMGRNGVGKTTLLKSIMGLLRPQSGHIFFGESAPAPAAPLSPSKEQRVQTANFAKPRLDLERLAADVARADSDGAVDITRLPPYARARMGIGYVPQGREIFPQLTVRENLQVGLMANPRKLREVPEYIFDYFPALKGFLDRKGGVLSGGQQQQLAIARALAAEPKLLILDEPTEGIQPSIILLIGKVLERLKEEGRVAVLLVEQYFEFALKLADSYYVMEKGAIVMDGAAAELDKELVKPYLAF